jgi:O-antigen ligase
VLIIGSLVYTAFTFFNSSPSENFDVQTLQHFHVSNPTASPLWEYFSYIQVASWMDLHPAYLSLHILFCILILLERMMDQTKVEWISVVLLSLFIFYLALLASRTAILSFVIILVYLMVNQLQKSPWNSKVSVLGCVLITFGGLIWLNPVSRFRIIQEPKATGLEIHQEVTQWNSVNLRLLEWQASWNIIKKSWITGVGTGDGQDALKGYYASFNTSTRNMDFDSHNQYLQTVIELGMMGFISLLLCLFLPAFRPGYSTLHLSFILLFGLMCLTESMLARQKGIVFFTLFQSLFLTVQPRTRQ